MSDAQRVSLWPPSFSAAIFDFDGTLAETWPLWRRVDEIFFSTRGLPFDEDASTTLATLGFAAGAQWCVERYRLRDEVADIVDEWNRLGAALYENEVRLRPGAEAYVRALRAQGVRVGLATTNDPHVLGAMRHVDVGALFDEVVCGREVARGKDHPDIYLEAGAAAGSRARGLRRVRGHPARNALRGAGGHGHGRSGEQRPASARRRAAARRGPLDRGLGGSSRLSPAAFPAVAKAF